MVNLTLRQLEYFVTISAAGSVTAASRQLHVAQSAISTSIADLERSLGVQLFTRHARGLALTRDGLEIFEEARRILRDVENLESYALDLSSELTGSLVVGCYSSLAAPMLPRLLATFAATHPLVRVEFVVGSADELISRVNSGECDVALTYDYGLSEKSLSPQLSVHHLTHRRPYVLFHPEHPLASQPRVRLVELAEDPFILLDISPAGEYFRSLFTAEGVEPNVRYRSHDFELVRGLVARGLGYSLLSQRTAVWQSYEGLPFKIVELPDMHTGLDVIAVVPISRRPNARVAAFIHECNASFSHES